MPDSPSNASACASEPLGSTPRCRSTHAEDKPQLDSRTPCTITGTPNRRSSIAVSDTIAASPSDPQ